MMCAHWSCCGWQKGTFQDEAMLNSGEIKPIALAVIELRLSVGISQSDSQLVSQSDSQLVSQSVENLLNKKKSNFVPT